MKDGTAAAERREYHQAVQCRQTGVQGNGVQMGRGMCRATEPYCRDNIYLPPLLIIMKMAK